jgi:uncharacterized FAD-dependent dehydrogenase
LLETYSPEYDVVIVGAGPAGLFAAYTLIESQTEAEKYRIAILEQGNEPEKRSCPAIDGICINCKYCNLVTGGGGAGLFSDGKLILDLNAGGHLETIISDKYLKDKLVKTVEKTLLRFDGNSEEQCLNQPTLEKYKLNAKKLGLNYKYYRVRHLGSHNLKGITGRFIKHITNSRNVEFFYNTKALDFIPIKDGYLIENENTNNHSRNRFKTKNIIFAVGKIGSNWLENILNAKKCFFEPNQCYFGLRLETERENLRDLFDICMDPKFSKDYPGNTKIKTHCYCKQGRVILLKYHRMALAGGHKIYTPKNLKTGLPIYSPKSNLNVLMSVTIDPWVILNKFNSYSNGKLVVQKLGDFLFNRTTANFGRIVPDNPNNIHIGNIRSLTENIKHFAEYFLDFLKILDKLTPGIFSEDNLLYGPVIEWWMKKVKVDPFMETSLPGIYAVGDGAGLSQGIVHSGATGIIAADRIKSKLKAKEELVIAKTSA